MLELDPQQPGTTGMSGALVDGDEVSKVELQKKATKTISHWSQNNVVYRSSYRQLYI